MASIPVLHCLFMPGFLDDASFVLECPKCGHKSEQMAGGLKAKPKFVCPGCGQPFDAAKFNRGITKADKAVGEPLREFDDLSEWGAGFLDHFDKFTRLHIYHHNGPSVVLVFHCTPFRFIPHNPSRSAGFPQPENR